MASLYRPTYTKPDPRTGGRVTRKVRKWYGKYRDSGGVLQCVPLCQDKTAAMAMLTDLVRKSQLQRAGLLDPAAEHLAHPIEDHLADYRVHLEAKARSTRHISETTRVIKNVLRACGFTVLANLQAGGDRLEQYLAARRRSGSSHRTINADLIAVRAFCRWLVQRKRMHDDPTSGFERLNEAEDHRVQRRALTDEEAERLYRIAFSSKHVVRRLAGPDRAILYLVAVRTGLRRGELRSLTRRSFDFSATVPTVTVQATESKRRRTDTLPLSPDVADLLQRYLIDRIPTQLIWPGSWWRQAAAMLRRDLKEAGIPAIDNEGRIIDFHALRTTFITSLARAGVMPAVAQKLARHSDINLTLNVYTQLQIHDLAAALAKLPIVADGSNQPRWTIAS